MVLLYSQRDGDWIKQKNEPSRVFDVFEDVPFGRAKYKEQGTYVSRKNFSWKYRLSLYFRGTSL